MYDRILVPTDGGGAAVAAADVAVSLARRFDATIDGIYVLELGGALPGLEDETQDAFAGRGEAAVAAVAETAADAGIDATTAVVEVETSVHETILAYVDRHEIDSVVMGTHGRTGLDRFVLGSVAELTLRESPVPVVTVHEETVLDDDIDDVLVPTDGSEGAAAAGTHAIDLCERTGATLHAVNVVDPTAVMTGVDTSVVLNAITEAGEQAVADLAGRATDAGVASVTTDVLHGSPYEQILEYADEEDVDVIVLGTHGRTGLRRYLLGSVAERVIRLGDVVTVTVPADDTGRN